MFWTKRWGACKTATSPDKNNPLCCGRSDRFLEPWWALQVIAYCRGAEDYTDNSTEYILSKFSVLITVWYEFSCSADDHHTVSFIRSLPCTWKRSLVLGHVDSSQRCDWTQMNSVEEMRIQRMGIMTLTYACSNLLSPISVARLTSDISGL